MTTLVNFRGLKIIDPAPLPGQGGQAIQDDFTNLVTWNPKSAWGQTRAPAVGDDNTADYYPGSLWMQTNTTPSSLFICQSSATGAAVWSPLVLTTAAPANGALLIGNGTGFTQATLTGTTNQVNVTNAAGSVTLSLPQPIASTSSPQFAQIGIGTPAVSTSGIFVGNTLSAAGTVRAVYLNPKFGPSVTQPIGIHCDCSLTSGGVAIGNAYNIRSDDFIANGVAITNLHGYYCANLASGTNNYGFRGVLTAATNRWNMFMDGTAANHLNGNLLIGTTTIPTNATLNLCLSGSSPVLGAATVDTVSLAAVDKAAGDRRLYIQSETGNAISLGNDRLNYAAANGYLSIGGTDVLGLSASAATLSDGINISVGTTTGTRVGTSTTQKLGFWNATPVAQYTAASVTTGFSAATGTAVLSGSTFTGNTGSTAYTIGDVVAALKKCGIIAS